jgi:hypothetical protein
MLNCMVTGSKNRILVAGLFAICTTVAAYSLYEDNDPPLTWTLLLCGIWSTGVWLWGEHLSTQKVNDYIKWRKLRARKRALRRVFRLKKQAFYTQDDLQRILPVIKTKISGWPVNEEIPQKWTRLSKTSLSCVSSFLRIAIREHPKSVRALEKEIHGIPDGDFKILELARIADPKLHDWRHINYAKIIQLTEIIQNSKGMRSVAPTVKLNF